MYHLLWESYCEIIYYYGAVHIGTWDAPCASPSPSYPLPVISPPTLEDRVVRMTHFFKGPALKRTSKQNEREGLVIDPVFPVQDGKIWKGMKRCHGVFLWVFTALVVKLFRSLGSGDISP